MTLPVNRRVVGLFINLFIFLQTTSGQYQIPDVTISALKPRGFRASIPDAPNVSLFVFQGNVNRPIGSTDVGTISGEVLQPKDGWWTVEEPGIELKIGDVINYYVVVTADRAGYIKDKLSYTVTALEDRTLTPNTPPPPPPLRPTPSPPECRPTATLVQGGTACAGQTIFEENFDNFRDDIWQIEQYLPSSPNFPFVSYQRLSSDPTVSVSNGELRIALNLQQRVPGFNADSIFTGSLNLYSGCTSPAAEACMKQASGADILPPIVSGRIISKGFAFTYGTVTIRAKLPQGDWIYPEMLLEPIRNKYGSPHYSSGVLQIASARGNKVLSSGTTDYSNKVLFGGPIMDLQCHDTLLSSRTLTNDNWGDSYHEYSVRWAPDRITLSVDGVEWARVEPTASGLRGRFPAQCTQLPRNLLQFGSKMAPFDDYFYITLGMGAGSITEFPDGVKTVNDRPKPWSNPGRKALLNFWQDMDSWLSTWNQPQLLVDYVKVVAL
ncbi:beta-1,3-glucan-binding protein-like [Spodoptera frugiperda]|uniref:Beta-1,3-glucan-binding protein-like n=1 Tax=Spodoptera frugiperda TaxID=7108 RepID=A0A9R0EMK8_SPOFR|nr:beta-1,3-glucan-binding protein-like [Spodoptera frugiperda]